MDSCDESVPKWWTPEGTARRVTALNTAEGEHARQTGSDVASETSPSQDVTTDDDDDDADCPTAAAPRLRVGSSQLVLSDKDLEEMGTFAHAVQHALHQARKARDFDCLRALGLSTIGDADKVFTLLGRRGQMPWLLPYFKRHLPYIQASNVVLLPPAHMLLHGLVKSWLCLSFGKCPGWKTQQASIEQPFIFSQRAIKTFHVCSIQSVYIVFWLIASHDVLYVLDVMLVGVRLLVGHACSCHACWCCLRPVLKL